MSGGLTSVAAALDQVVGFLEHFSDLEDPRRPAKILYSLDEALLLRLPGVLTGYESWVEIAKYGDKKLSFLRRFRPFKEGTPSHDQLGDLVTALEAAKPGQR